MKRWFWMAISWIAMIGFFIAMIASFFYGHIGPGIGFLFLSFIASSALAQLAE